MEHIGSRSGPGQFVHYHATALLCKFVGAMITRPRVHRSGRERERRAPTLECACPCEMCARVRLLVNRSVKAVPERGSPFCVLEATKVRKLSRERPDEEARD